MDKYAEKLREYEKNRLEKYTYFEKETMMKIRVDL